jgi:hypothetical protein
MRKKPPFLGVIRISFVLGCGLLGIASVQSAGEEGSPTLSQQDFAIKLARVLGHGGEGDGASAIALLSSLSIIPGRGPGAKWEPQAPATTKFVADIQASLQLVLKRAAEDLAIAPPPTLDLFVFEVPPAPQRIFFTAEDPAAQTASSGGRHLGLGGPTDPPGADAPPPPTIPPPPTLTREPNPGSARLPADATNSPPPSAGPPLHPSPQ